MDVFVESFDQSHNLPLLVDDFASEGHIRVKMLVEV